ncbi:Hypothetical predicted protein, partial [Mytilus galloprovincialis]
EHTCSCSNGNHTVVVRLLYTYLCKNPENGLCDRERCVVYERGVLNKDYLCGVYYYNDDVGWLYSTQNCSEKLRFICEGGKGMLYRYALALYKRDGIDIIINNNNNENL